VSAKRENFDYSILNANEPADKMSALPTCEKRLQTRCLRSQRLRSQREANLTS